MNNTLSLSGRIHRICSSSGPLLLILPRTPISGLLVQEARSLVVPGAVNVAKWTVALVSGLGAFDTVSGATVITQTSPGTGSTFSATNGSPLNFTVQITGAPSLCQSWKLTGSIPPGLVHANRTSSNIDSITGTPAYAGPFPKVYSFTLTAYRYAGYTGDSKSKNFTMTLNAPSLPTITTQPQPVTVISGAATTLAVVASGASSYQWYRGIAGDETAPEPGMTSASATTPLLFGSASFWVKVTNAGGSVNSAAVLVTVVAPVAITTQPASVSVNPGDTATLTIAASGTLPDFQWYSGDSGDTSSPISGATGAAFTTPPLFAGARYWVRVSNTASTIDSATAVISVTAPFSAWLTAHFDEAQLANPEVSGALADPDGDGMNNTQEYDFGFVPLTADPAALVQSMNSAGAFSCSFVAQATTGAGYAGRTRHYALESSADLSTWVALPGFADVVGAGQNVSYVDPGNVSARFVRLKVWLTTP